MTIDFIKFYPKLPLIMKVVSEMYFICREPLTYWMEIFVRLLKAKNCVLIFHILIIGQL